MKRETREALKDAVRTCELLEKGARDGAFLAGANNDLARAIREGGRADMAREIARLIRDVIDE